MVIEIGFLEDFELKYGIWYMYIIIGRKEGGGFPPVASPCGVRSVFLVSEPEAGRGNPHLPWNLCSLIQSPQSAPRFKGRVSEGGRNVVTVLCCDE